VQDCPFAETKEHLVDFPINLRNFPSLDARLIGGPRRWCRRPRRFCRGPSPCTRAKPPDHVDERKRPGEHSSEIERVAPASRTVFWWPTFPRNAHVQRGGRSSNALVAAQGLAGRRRAENPEGPGADGSAPLFIELCASSTSWPCSEPTLLPAPKEERE